MSNDDEKTLISYRVKWFWTGYSIPAEPNQGLAYAHGASVSMLGAARFVMGSIHWLRSAPSVDLVEYSRGENRVTKRGIWFNCQTAAHLLEKAARELDDTLPSIVPVRTGNGILYASGPSPDVCEWDELKALAGRVVVADALVFE